MKAGGIPWRSSGLTPCFHCTTAGDTGSIPGWGTNIPRHMTQSKKRGRENEKGWWEEKPLSHCLQDLAYMDSVLGMMGYWVTSWPGLFLSLPQLTLPAWANTKWNVEMESQVREGLSQLPRLHTFGVLPTPTRGQHQYQYL